MEDFRKIKTKDDFIKIFGFEPKIQFRFFLFDENDTALFQLQVKDKDETSFIIEIWDFIDPKSYKLLINMILNESIDIDKYILKSLGPVGDVIDEYILDNAKVEIVKKPKFFKDVDIDKDDHFIFKIRI